MHQEVKKTGLGKGEPEQTVTETGQDSNSQGSTHLEIPYELASEILNTAVNRDEDIKRSSARHAAKNRVYKDVPELKKILSEQQKDPISVSEVVNNMRSLGVDVKSVIDAATSRAETLARVRDSWLSERRKLGLPDDASVRWFMAEKKLRSKVEQIKKRLPELVEKASGENRTDLDFQLRIPVRSIPFETWRLPGYSFLYAIPILGQLALMLNLDIAVAANKPTDVEKKQRDGKKKEVSALKIATCTPIPETCKSPAVKDLNEALYSHGCKAYFGYIFNSNKDELKVDVILRGRIENPL